MPEKPDYVKKYESTKPNNTEVRPVHGKWYLYEVKNVYDPQIKRTRKKTIQYLGSIKEEGFVPKGSQKEIVRPAILNDVVEVGAVMYFYERTAFMRARLQKYFPDTWVQIYNISLIRAIYGSRLRRLGLHYEDSILSYMFPDVHLSAPAITELLNAVGRERAQIREYMKDSTSGGDRYILFDGHRLLSSSRTMENAELGYDSKLRYKPQINLIYMFTLEDGYSYPAYYKQYIGSTPDVSAFSDILKESGVLEDNCTVIADKGFADEDDFELLNTNGLKYVVPLKRGNHYVKGKVPASAMGYEEAFTYHKRTIHCTSFKEDGFVIHLFLDMDLMEEEMTSIVSKNEKRNEDIEKKVSREEKRRKRGKGRLTDQELEELVPLSIRKLYEGKEEMGTITIRTNRMELNSAQVYNIYKQRQAIEQFFKTYDDTLDFEASYMRNNYSNEAMLFLNHLTSVMTISTIEEIDSHGQAKNISYRDLMSTLKKIKAARIDKEWMIPPLKKSVQKNCDKMNLDFKDLSVLGL